MFISFNHEFKVFTFKFSPLSTASGINLNSAWAVTAFWHYLIFQGSTIWWISIWVIVLC